MNQALQFVSAVIGDQRMPVPVLEWCTPNSTALSTANLCSKVSDADWYSLYKPWNCKENRMRWKLRQRRQKSCTMMLFWWRAVLKHKEPRPAACLWKFKSALELDDCCNSTLTERHPFQKPPCLSSRDSRSRIGSERKRGLVQQLSSARHKKIDNVQKLPKHLQFPAQLM